MAEAEPESLMALPLPYASRKLWSKVEGEPKESKESKKNVVEE